MLRTFLAVAAGRVIIDGMSNQVSIIDVFEGLKAQSFPIILPSLTVLFYIRRDEGDATAKDLSLKCSVDDAETLKVPVSIDFQQGNTTRAIIGFDGFVIPKAGTLKVALLDGDNVIGILELPVDQLDIPSPHVKTNPPQQAEA